MGAKTYFIEALATHYLLRTQSRALVSRLEQITDDDKIDPLVRLKAALMLTYGSRELIHTDQEISRPLRSAFNEELLPECGPTIIERLASSDAFCNALFSDGESCNSRYEVEVLLAIESLRLRAPESAGLKNLTALLDRDDHSPHYLQWADRCRTLLKPTDDSYAGLSDAQADFQSFMDAPYADNPVSFRRLAHYFEALRADPDRIQKELVPWLSTMPIDPRPLSRSIPAALVWLYSFAPILRSMRGYDRSSDPTFPAKRPSSWRANLSPNSPAAAT